MPVTLKRRLSSGDFEPPDRPAPLTVLEPVARETLGDQIYGQLREALMAGQFRPGQAITLRSVAEALGVSHMPVRAALQRLEAAGAMVAPANGRTLVIPEMRLAEMCELRDIRVELEGLAAERAAALITNTELLVVEEHCHLMQAAAATGNLDNYIRENWAFHTAVYRASKMKQLLAIVEGLWLRIGPYICLMMPDRAALAASMPNHHRVLEALRARDGAAARAGIAADINDSAQALERILPQ
ncbi:MAG TPA: GntR family transcriptional regulator [Rhizomicrobium sp.]